jgi:phosphatidylglycerol:prolipoprotein diacylglycerol transferase
MIPVFFTLGPLTIFGHQLILPIYSYGTMMAAGFLAADFVIRSECRRRGYDPDYSSSIVIWAAIAGISGARIYAILDDLPTYLADPWSMIFSASGFVWYGGMFSGITAVYFVSRWYGINFGVTADMTAPALALGQAIGRIGCHLSGDGDWGMPTTMPWGVAYKNAIVHWDGSTVLKLDAHNQLVSAYFEGVRVHPAALYETALYTIVFAILWSMRKRPAPPGQLLCWYFILAGASRFSVEFVRVNPRVLWFMSEAQVIAIGMMIFGAVAIVISNRRRPNAVAARRETVSA